MKAGENRKRREKLCHGKVSSMDNVEQGASVNVENKEHHKTSRISTTTEARVSPATSSAERRPIKSARRRKPAKEQDETDVLIIDSSSSASRSSGYVTDVSGSRPSGPQPAGFLRRRTFETVETGSPLPSAIPDLFQQDGDGDTFLHIAVAQGNQPLTEFLIRGMKTRGLDIYNNLRQTPLHLAIITRQSNLVKKLLEGGADVNVMDRNGQTALHLACQSNDMDCVNVIRDVISPESSKLKKESKNFQGLSVLHLAVLRGNQQMVRAVVDMGANINEQDSNSGRTALHHAVEAGKYHVAEYLISRGADVNKVTFAGNTALHTASGREMNDMAKLLLKHGASINIANREGNIPKVARTIESAKALLHSDQSKRRKR